MPSGSVTRVQAGPPKMDSQSFGEFAGRALALAEVVAVAQRRARALRDRPPEPLVLVGGVVGNQVDDDAQTQVVGVADQGVRVQQRPEHRVHRAVVGDVVAGVGLGEA